MKKISIILAAGMLLAPALLKVLPFGKDLGWASSLHAQNIGINTDGTPAETGVMLDIKNPTAKATTAAVQTVFQLKSFDANTDALKMRLGFKTDATQANRYGFIDFPDFIASTPTYLNLILQPSGGNVGISTTAPTEKLEVQGNVQVGNSSVPNAGLKITRTFSAVNANIHAYIPQNNSPNYQMIFGGTWTGEQVGTLDQTSAPYINYSSGQNTFRIGSIATTPFASTDMVDRIKIALATGNVCISCVGTNNTRLEVANENAATNTVLNILQLHHATTGLPAPDFGTGLLFTGESSGTPENSMGTIQTRWLNATDGFLESAMDFQTSDLNSGGLTTHMTILGDGYVGINKRSPAATLHLAGESSSTISPKILLEREDLSTILDEQLGNISFDATNNPSTTDASVSIEAYASQGHSATAKGGYLSFFTKPNNTVPGGASIERMRINHNGNVGIGTTNPYEQLQIGDRATFRTADINFNAEWNDINAGQWSRLVGESAFSLHWEQPTDVFNIRAAGAASASTTITWTDALTVKSDGDVGINTNTPDAKLVINDGHLQCRQTTDVAATSAVTYVTYSVVAGATDMGGKISITPTAAAGSVTFTFDLAFTVAPIVILTPRNSAAATDIGLVWVTTTATTFTVNFNATAAASAHQFYYMALEAK